MRKLVTGTQMKEVDYFAINEIGIPSVVLMERAALSVVEEIEKRVKGKERILVVCGTGNNGADGAAIARMLHLHDFLVTVLMIGDRENWTEEMKLQSAINEKLGMFLSEDCELISDSYEIIIDALFGVGLTREIKGIFEDVINRLNQRNSGFMVAVDIPSGIHAGTGKVMNTAIRADLTVTFGFEKVGTALYPGKEFSKDTVVKDIGFPDCEGDWKERYYAYDREDLKKIPERKDYSHKGTYGKVLIVAGSKGMCGAAYLSALAAYRTGAGLVKILTTEDNRQVLQTLLPEAIITSYSSDMEEENPEEFKTLVETECAWASVIVLGPGLGRGRYIAKLIESILLSAYVPIILDADALNTVAEFPYLTQYFTENIIITPHLGEMARLIEKDIEEVQENLLECALSYRDTYGVTCVLKDAATVVAQKDGRIYINTSGNGGMAKAGSGDVLTGIIAGLIILGFSEDEASAMGVYLHGLAGERAGELYGRHSLLAREIANLIMNNEINDDGRQKNGRTI